MKFSFHASFFLSALAVGAGSFGSASAETFEAVDFDVPQTPTKIMFPSKCMCGENHPVVVSTIEVADSVTISTNPPGILDGAEDEDGTLILEWGPGATGYTTGGIKIGMPADQLTGVSVTSFALARILSGFTSVGSLEVNGPASTIDADLSTLSTTGLTIKATGGGIVNAISAKGLDSGSVDGFSTLTIAVPTASNLEVSGGSTVNIDGSVDSLTVSGFLSKINVSGAVTSIDLTGGATANAASCPATGNIDATSSCNAISPSVTVSTPTLPEIPETGWEVECGREECYSLFNIIKGATSPAPSMSYRTGLTAAALVGVALAM